MPQLSHSPLGLLCKISSCRKAVKHSGTCAMHLERFKRLGSYELLPKPGLAERFWAGFVRSDTGCWLWRNPRKSGYGSLSISNKYHRAHRVAYELLVGPIPDGMVLDHLCRNRRCVNPSHLEPVTQGENVRRGRSPQAINWSKTHCDAGHPFDSKNTHITPKGHRSCRACHRDSERRRRVVKL